MLRVLAPEFSPADLDTLDELRVGVVPPDDADALVGGRVREAASHFPQRREITNEIIVAPEGIRADISDLFQSEVASVHRELYAEHAELYGDELAAKIEVCLALPEGVAARATAARAEYRERCTELIDELDLLLTPTLPCVAPRVGIGDAVLRRRLIHYTFPFNALGWPALALPCGAAEDGLPASVQLVGKPGEDALVLAAGRLLASLVRGTPAAS